MALKMEGAFLLIVVTLQSHFLPRNRNKITKLDLIKLKTQVNF
jgi:hypothetical protein